MSSKVVELFQSVKTTLAASADKAKAKSSERYFKNLLPFYGFSAPSLKTLFKSFYSEQFSQASAEEHFELASLLIRSEYWEEKEMGVQLLNKNISFLNKTHVSHLGELIDTSVNNWGVCDNLCGKVLFEMIKRNNEITELLREWKDSPNMWRQRASCVSFVKLARFGKHNQIIYDICASCVKSPERFVQLGNGWVLRELGLADKKGVIKFIEDHYDHFSREGLRYAIEKMDGSTRQSLLNYNGGKKRKVRETADKKKTQNKRRRTK